MSTVLWVSQLRVNQLLGEKLREIRIDELYCRGSRGSDLLSQIKRKLENWSIPKELKCLLHAKTATVSFEIVFYDLKSDRTFGLEVEIAQAKSVSTIQPKKATHKKQKKTFSPNPNFVDF